MLRLMCGVSLMDRVRSEEIRERVGVECIESWVRQQRLRWFGQVEKKEESVEIRKTLYMKAEAEGACRRGRPKRRWMDAVNDDMKMMGPIRDMAANRDAWRRKIHGPVNPPNGD